MFSQSAALRLLRTQAIRGGRFYSIVGAPDPPPPLLVKLREDLKDAMRSRDTYKLNILRSLLSDITNASKPTNMSKLSSPPSTDIYILSFITRTKTKTLESLAQFRKAGRKDLVSVEEAQIAILDSYAAMVETVGKDEIKEVVQKVVEDAKKAGEKTNMAAVVKEVMNRFEGRPVVKGEAADVVKAFLNPKH